jgi:hypothetical protein
MDHRMTNFNAHALAQWAVNHGYLRLADEHREEHRMDLERIHQADIADLERQLANARTSYREQLAQAHRQIDALTERCAEAVPSVVLAGTLTTAANTYGDASTHLPQVLAGATGIGPDRIHVTVTGDGLRIEIDR